MHTAMQWVTPTVAAAAAAAAAPSASASPLKLLQRSEEEDKQAEQTSALRRHVAQVEQEVRRIFDGLGSPGEMERTGQGRTGWVIAAAAPQMRRASVTAAQLDRSQSTAHVRAHVTSVERSGSRSGFATARQSDVWSESIASLPQSESASSAAWRSAATVISSVAHLNSCNLLFSTAGEILFNGVSRIMDPQHLNAGAPGTRSLFDLGSGCGRLCVQVFLQFPNLVRVVGVEVSTSLTSGGCTLQQSDRATSSQLS